MVSVMQEMEKKHMEEREIMLSLLQDPSLQELQEPAANMSRAERQERLSQLRTKAYNLHMQDQGSVCLMLSAILYH